MVIVPTQMSSNVGCGEERTASLARTCPVARLMYFEALSTSYGRWVAMAKTMTHAEFGLLSD
jgi:hypothetical protein